MLIHFRCIWLFATPWTVARQVLLSMGFPRQEYWNGLPFPPPGNLPDPGVEPTSPTLVGGFFTTEPPGKPIPFITYGVTGCLWRCSTWSVFLPIKTWLYKNPSSLDLTLQHVAILLVLQFWLVLYLLAPSLTYWVPIVWKALGTWILCWKGHLSPGSSHSHIKTP